MAISEKMRLFGQKSSWIRKMFEEGAKMKAAFGADNVCDFSLGNPDLPPPPQFAAVVRRLADHQEPGMHAYMPNGGYPWVREALAKRMSAEQGVTVAGGDMLMTCGAAGGLNVVFKALLNPGDEVILLAPYFVEYNFYLDNHGGIGRVVNTSSDFNLDLAAIEAAITVRTKAIIINSPNNPTGSLLDAADLDALAELTRDTDIVVLSDEVYEHIVYDGARHASVAAHPQLSTRSIVVSSFGKTYHITGWKIGYVLAAAELMSEFRKVHQFNVFTVNTPCQLGIAEYMRDPARHLGLAAFYQHKRDFFREQLRGTKFELLPCRGTYFQLARYDAISDLSDREFARWLTREVGVAAIPLSAFYGDGFDQRVVRFCFAKKDETLRAALERLRKL